MGQARTVRGEVACKAAMLMCEAFMCGDEGSSIGGTESLITVVQEMGHPCFNIEDHLAEHTISPTEPVTFVSHEN